MQTRLETQLQVKTYTMHTVALTPPLATHIHINHAEVMVFIGVLVAKHGIAFTVAGLSMELGNNYHGQIVVVVGTV